MAKIVFTNFKPITNDDLMVDTDFYNWLHHQPVRIKARFVTALFKYLTPKGFDINKHILPAGQLNAHKYVFEHHWFRQFRGLDRRPKGG